MAKKKVTRRKTSPQPEADSLDEARQRLRRAREEMRQARQRYTQLRGDTQTQTAEQPDSAVRDIVDDTLKFVRKYPALGVSAAVAVGFFVGRLFRR